MADNQYIDSNTLLLIHGDSIIDSSFNNIPLKNNSVIISDKQSKFGDKSLYFNGSGARISYPSLYTEFRDNDFTIDWWEYAETGATCRYASLLVGSSGMAIGNPEGKYINATSVGNANWDIANRWNALNVTPNVWVHWAIVRNGNTAYSFKNGKLFATNNTFKGSIQSIPEAESGIGSNQSGVIFFKGYMNEFRISNIARWTSDFIPPDKPYENKPIEFITPITDRTMEDVTFSINNQSNPNDLKGALNYNDLNRIEGNIEFICDRLNKIGYYSDLDIKTNWIEDDLLWDEEADRIRYNIKFLILKFTEINAFPQINGGQYLDYREVNNWETITLKLNEYINLYGIENIYTNEYICGEY